jgi:hypothetical protein
MAWPSSASLTPPLAVSINPNIRAADILVTRFLTAAEKVPLPKARVTANMWYGTSFLTYALSAYTGAKFMKSFILIGVLILASACAATVALAGERVSDAALGAGSGLLVAGPVGAVAGGVIGYVAGPQIGHGMGLHHHYRHRAHRDTPRLDR